ncbi:MAG: hypothetical protein VX640_12445 [Pseudomonadota bacterium]|nr:hypothetical protein [Pseudomonadota bacterium]
MKSKTPYLVRVFVPENPTVYGFIGGGAGLFGDLANFLSDRVTAGLLLALFALGAGVAAAFCVAKAMSVTEKTEDNAIAVGKCLPCDAFRASVVAALIYLLLMIIGGGQSATETIGESLGLIKERVEEISEDVTAIRETTDAYAIIDRPSGAADYFHNAWIYQNMRRDDARAFEQLKALYARGEKGKLDSAELYFNVGKVSLGRDALIAEMVETGRRNRDAALLTVAARNAPDEAQSVALYEEARRIDPDFPFAWWDIQRPRAISATAGIEGNLASLRTQKADIDAFRARIDGQPTGAFFFLPQHQPDYDSLARQNAESIAQNIATYEGMIERQQAGAAAQRARKEAKPDVRFRWRDNYTKDLLEVGVFVADAQRYAWRFNGGEWREDQRIELYHEAPRQGVFEMRWQDRQSGEWFGPFRYEYDAQ